MVIERSTGAGALVLILVVLVLLFIASDIKINIPEGNETTENFTGSRTLHKLNPQVSCDECVKNCQWTTLKPENECKAGCGC